MTELKLIEERPLMFRYDQELVDPRDGLSVFGPYDADEPGHPSSLSIAIVGTSTGIGLLSGFFAQWKNPIFHENESRRRLWPTFPGFAEIFGFSWPEKSTEERVVDADEIKRALALSDSHQRIFKVVDLYLEQIRIIAQSERPVSLIYCVVPDDIYQFCRPESFVRGTERISSRDRNARIAGQADLFQQVDLDIYQFALDFRRQIKARAMQYDIPIQLVKESTVGPSEMFKMRKGTTPLPDRAWNLATVSYYKAGGRPWKLTGVREGVCYVGIAFRRLGNAHEKTACCAAQMFLNDGDGVVFRGEDGLWYSPQDKAFHLTRDASKKLLSGLLKTYEEQRGKPLKEIFIHSHSELWQEEYKGFVDASPPGSKVIGVRVHTEREELRLYRSGTRPVHRGTYVTTGTNSAYLWGTGFKPRLMTYDGWEVPAPLRIEIQFGEADIETVVRDIFGLTKLNYNNCKLGDSVPVTIKYSRAVGEILASNPKVTKASPKFKMYI